jgi:hypothetical protein
MDTTKLLELIQIAKDSGVTYLKFGEIEFSISDKQMNSPILVPTEPIAPTTQELSNEDMLFYSVEAPLESKE